MESRAEMSCVLKVNINCETCRRKVMDVLRNLHGVYSVVIDAEKGTLKIQGNVNPNVILMVLEKYGKHGEVSCIKFEGQVREPIYHYNHHHNNYYGGNRFGPYGSVHPYPLIGGPDPYFPWGDGHHYPPVGFPPLPPPPPPLYPPLPPSPRTVINYFPLKASTVVQSPDMCNIM